MTNIFSHWNEWIQASASLQEHQNILTDTILSKVPDMFLRWCSMTKLHFEVFEANEGICVKINIAEKYYKMGDLNYIHFLMSTKIRMTLIFTDCHNWNYINTHNDLALFGLFWKSGNNSRPVRCSYFQRSDVSKLVVYSYA